MRENRTYGSEGGEGESSSLPLSHDPPRFLREDFHLNSMATAESRMKPIH